MNDERARVFVALELPEEARQELARWRAKALPQTGGLRLLVPEDLHVTLCFLGWKAVGQIEQIVAACAVVSGLPSATLRLGEAIWLPSKRPRVLAVQLDDLRGRLGEVQSELSSALQAGGWYLPESRRFMAHVTVARLAKGARPPVRRLEPPPAMKLSGSRVVAYRSRLTPRGARYEALGGVELGSARTAAAARPGDPVTVVRRFHSEQARAYGGGPLEPLRALLAEDVIWHVPGESRIAGEHRGVEAVLSYFETRRDMTDATFAVSVHGAAMIGDRVVQLAGGSAEREGRQASWETVGVFRVLDGRIAECWLIPFDQAEFDRIWG